MSEPEKPHSPALRETHVWADSGSSEVVRDLTGMTLGDFQVERMLGRGGMGEVYLARQVSLNRPVALKVLRPDLISKPAYLGRFEAEATMVAKLNHPNIVHVYTLGSVGEVRFIAMEYVQGTNLRDYLQKKGALDLPVAFAIMKQAVVAIGAAGEVGLVHRDIKPENLLLTRKGQVKVADFGLCRDQDAEHLHLTQPGVTMGTPLYMSPEQAQGHSLDHRSDLYSLGVTFYHMIAGAPPFRADTALAVALKHVKDTPVRLIVHRPDIPVELDRLVMKAMAKHPDQRYQSAAEMLRDLNRVRDSFFAASSTAASEAEISVTTNGAAPLLAPTLAASGVTTPTQPSSSAMSLSALSEFIPKATVSSKHRLLIVGLALVAGLGWGWYTRPPDLLAASAPDSTEMPGLWMVPEWASLIEKQKTAEGQYHFARLDVVQGDRVAAWLAIPGYFPEDREYCTKAYIQLTRQLLRQHDVVRLRTLATEITNWKAGARGAELAILAKAALCAIDDDLGGVTIQLEDKTYGISSLTDVGLFELAMAITDEALVAANEKQESVVERRLKGLKETIRKSLLANAEFRESTGPPIARRLN